jgi:hypothetical protein
MDTFYKHLKERIDEYIDTPPDTAWDGIIIKQQAPV